MCNTNCINFVQDNLKQSEVKGKKILEIGSRDVNGSVRPYIESLGPFSYTGVDIINGPGVDEICNILDLLTKYGENQFDVVICTEVMEHVENWRKAISNIKNILKPKGVLTLTVPSKGFPYHGYPFDYWRYEADDLKTIFSDTSINVIQKDTSRSGVFIKTYIPQNFTENTFESYKLYSILRGKRIRKTVTFDGLLHKPRKLQVKIKKSIRKFFVRVTPSWIKDIIKSRLLKE